MKKVDKIIFVTHNRGKVATAQKYFKNIKFHTFDYELEEPRSDNITEIAKSKVLQAYKLVGAPCIALDSGFYIEELNGFPKAFVNFSLETIGIKGILKLMEGKENRTCCFKECLAFYDGEEIQYFYGENKGKVSNEILGVDTDKKWSDLWYIYKPKNHEKTLAQMTDEEREKRKKTDESIQAMEVFAKWFQKRYN